MSIDADFVGVGPLGVQQAPRSAVQDGTPLAFSQVFEMKQAVLFLVEAKALATFQRKTFMFLLYRQSI